MGCEDKFRTVDLTDIKPGDFVWIKFTGGGKFQRRYEQITRVTPTQFVIESKFENSENETQFYTTRFKREDGWKIGVHSPNDRIVAVALEDEMRVFDNQRNLEKERVRRIEDKESALTAFLQAFNVDHGIVKYIEYNGTWSITLDELTEEQVTNYVNKLTTKENVNAG